VQTDLSKDAALMDVHEHRERSVEWEGRSVNGPDDRERSEACEDDAWDEREQ
jgi:hypothetical protein